jgi:uncharacterized protein YpmS
MFDQGKLRMKHSTIRFLFALLALLAASLACNLPGKGSGKIPTAAPMSEEEQRKMEEGLKLTLASSNGEVTITVTQQQINSYISAKMAAQKEQVFSDPVVVLTKGNMEVNGKVIQGPLTLNLKIVLQPGVGADGNPSLVIKDISLGGLPVPDEMKAQIGNLVDESLKEYLANQNSGFKVRQITIEEGQITVTGSMQ